MLEKQWHPIIYRAVIGRALLLAGAQWCLRIRLQSSPNQYSYPSSGFVLSRASPFEMFVFNDKNSLALWPLPRIIAGPRGWQTDMLFLGPAWLNLKHAESPSGIVQKCSLNMGDRRRSALRMSPMILRNTTFCSQIAARRDAGVTGGDGWHGNYLSPAIVAA